MTRSPDERGALCELEIPLVERAVSSASRPARSIRHTPRVSVLVPTLDEQHELPRLLDHLAALDGHWETIVADGGSRDATRELARARPLRPHVIEAHRRPRRPAQRRRPRRDRRPAAVPARRQPPAARRLRLARRRLAQHAARPGRQLRAALRRRRRAARRLRADPRRRLPAAAPPRPVLRRLVGLGAPRRVREPRRLPRDPDHGRLRVRPALERSGATRCLPGPATTSSRRWRRAGIARTVLAWGAHPPALRRRRQTPSSSPGCTGSCVGVPPMGRLAEAAGRDRGRGAAGAWRPDRARSARAAARCPRPRRAEPTNC